MLFRSAATVASIPTLLGALQQSSISLCIVQESPSALNRVAEVTGGLVCALGQLGTAASLFSLETAWDACSSFRTTPGVKVSATLGPCCVLANGVTLFPVLTSTQSVFYELTTDQPNVGNCHFQLALRFTDDSGVRKVRVINGRVPFAEAMRLPVDEAALALFLHRKRLMEGEGGSFASRVATVRSLILGPSLLSLFLYAGLHQDEAFIQGTSVEGFALSNVATTVVCGEQTFRVLWTPALTVIWPRASPEQEDAMKIAIRHFGLLQADFYYPESEESFDAMLPNSATANAWGSNLRTFEL